MKTSDELQALKMTLKTLSVKVKRIENVNKKLKKLLIPKAEETAPTQELKSPRRKINYFERLGIEQRMRNIMTSE